MSGVDWDPRADGPARWMRLTGARSLQFNIVSKGLRSDRLSYWLHEAAGEMRDLMLPTVAGATAKL